MTNHRYDFTKFPNVTDSEVTEQFPVIPESFSGLKPGERFMFPVRYVSDLHLTARGLTAPARKSKLGYYADALRIQNQLIQHRTMIAHAVPVVVNHRIALEFSSALVVEHTVLQPYQPSLLDLMVQFP